MHRACGACTAASQRPSPPAGPPACSAVGSCWPPRRAPCCPAATPAGLGTASDAPSCHGPPAPANMPPRPVAPWGPECAPPLPLLPATRAEPGRATCAGPAACLPVARCARPALDGLPPRRAAGSPTDAARSGSGCLKPADGRGGACGTAAAPGGPSAAGALPRPARSSSSGCRHRGPALHGSLLATGNLQQRVIVMLQDRIAADSNFLEHLLPADSAISEHHRRAVTWI